MSEAEKTVEESTEYDEIGDYTRELTSISEDTNLSLIPSHTIGKTWMQKIVPLTKSWTVRVLAIVNILIGFSSLVIIICITGLIAVTALHKIESRKFTQDDFPCLYQWSEWSACSATCAKTSSRKKTPFMIRKVIQNTIVQARGKYQKSIPCPTNILNMVEKAPCNTHRCPRDLSQFNFIGPFVYNLSEKEKVCYKIRNIPTGDYLIRINTHTLTIDASCIGL